MDMTSGLKEYLKMISTAGGRIFLAAFFMALAVSVIVRLRPGRGRRGYRDDGR